jgi:general secretion pathway protein H
MVVLVVMAMQRIFLTSNKPRLNKASGFTLIEVMVTIGILAALVAVGAPKLFRKDGNLKTAARGVIVVVKEIRNRARLFNSTYRLAVRLDKGEQSYWIEKGNGPVLVDPAKLKEQFENRDRKAEEGAPPPLFQMDKTMLKEPKKLPPNLKFSQVETSNMPEPMTEGVAYIHFFPQGMLEPSTIQISDNRNNTWTLVFNPLTGQTDIIEKAVPLKSIQR